MDLEEYWKLLGHLVGNLQSFEFAIRAYLYARADPPHTPLASGQILDSIKVGDIVPVNAMTDYSSFGQLIDRYNRLLEKTHPELQLDRSIVLVRDAIAHGRVSTSDPTKDLVLLKFNKPSESATSVTYTQALTPGWLKVQTRRVCEEVTKIRKAPGTPIASDS